jgi:hypothetical protein
VAPAWADIVDPLGEDHTKELVPAAEALQQLPPALAPKGASGTERAASAVDWQRAALAGGASGAVFCGFSSLLAACNAQQWVGWMDSGAKPSGENVCPASGGHRTAFDTAPGYLHAVDRVRNDASWERQAREQHSRRCAGRVAAAAARCFAAL